MRICPDCSQLAWARALMTPRNLENHRPQGNTPPLNLARNSLTTLSNFEFTSAEFCGFLTIAHLSDHRITCEIDDELRWRAPTLRRIARCSHLTTHELPRTDIDIAEILRSVGKHSRHNRRIVTACAGLRRWCARNHFALQLLGF